MKTAEEFYKEYYPPKMHLFRDKHDRELQLFSINDLLAFAEYVSNAKLQEAAENAKLQVETPKGFYQADEEHPDQWKTIRVCKESILSLITKDTTKD